MGIRSQSQEARVFPLSVRPAAGVSNLNAQNAEESRYVTSDTVGMAGNAGCRCERWRRLDRWSVIRQLTALGGLLAMYGFIWAGRISLDALMIL